MTEYTGTAFAYRQTPAYLKAEAKRARKGARLAMEMEMTAIGRGVGRMLMAADVGHPFYEPGLYGKLGHWDYVCHVLHAPPGYQPPDLTPNWRQRLTLRRSRPRIGSPWWLSVRQVTRRGMLSWLRAEIASGLMLAVVEGTDARGRLVTLVVGRQP
jgi:hypothetical protein